MLGVFILKGVRKTKLQCYDRTYIKDYLETPEGYLTVIDVPIVRTGVFPYNLHSS